MTLTARDDLIGLRTMAPVAYLQSANDRPNGCQLESPPSCGSRITTITLACQAACDDRQNFSDRGTPRPPSLASAFRQANQRDVVGSWPRIAV